jgi:rod shape-determining protein MreD
MRFLPYAILAYLAIGLQIGLGRFVEWRGAQPNLVLIAVVFIAVYAPREAALLGCFAMGVIQDLLTPQPPGLYALSYGIVAMVIGVMQATVKRAHPLTHLSLTLLAATLTGFMLWFNALIWSSSSADDPVPVAVNLDLGRLFIGIIYTAVLGPFVIGVLHRIRRAFAFQRNRQRGYR